MSAPGLISLPGAVWPAGPGARAALGDCTLVIATYRRSDSLATLLDLLATLPDPPAEVVVVDGSPDRDTQHAITARAERRTLPFDVIYVQSPRGLTRQRNVGIDISTRPFVFFLDDDCRPAPGYFRAIRDVFAADAATSVGAVSGSIINEMGKPLSMRWRVRFLLRLVPRGTPGTYYPTATSVPRSLAAPFTGVRQVDMVPGGAAAYRREVLLGERFSLFFEGYAQGEDLEMSMRIGRRWMLLWCGDAHVVHDDAPSGRPASAEKGRMEVRNRFFIRERHSPGAPRIERIRFWADIAYIAALDIARFVRRPRSFAPLRHALGCAQGAVSCFRNPPRYDEPPARREYELATGGAVIGTAAAGSPTGE